MTTLAVLRCIVVAIIGARNVHGFTTRSYDLDVPGSKPIRIIEADPGWDLNTRKPLPTLPNQYERNDRNDRLPQSLDVIQSNYKPFRHRGEKDDRFKHRPDLEHRTTKPDVIANRNDRGDEEDNSEKLKKFLNSYAQNVKQFNVQVEDEDQIHLDEKFVDIPEGETAKPEKSKSWNLLHFDKIQQTPQDQKGWVSMEAVPWSVSKISKWHGKPKKDKYQNQHQNQHNGYYEQNSRPYNDRFQVQEFQRPSLVSFPKPIRPNGGQRPNAPNPPNPSNGYYDDPLEEGDDEDPVEDDYYNRRPSSPSFPRPSATYGQKVNLHTVQTYGNTGNSNNKRPFKDTNCKNPNHNHHGGVAGYNGQSHDDGGIITDGLPPNFPEHDYGNRRRGVAGAGDSIGAASAGGGSHPFKGDVLPPLNDGRVNMTTSHGGLLQVDATFQSVEEAAQKHHALLAKRQKLKARPQRRPTKVRPQLAALTSKRPQRVQYQVQNGDSLVAASAPGGAASDPSAVLAAVGAGMIPAGMALLVPMAMSGKRRRRHVTVSPYTTSVELTLPSSL